MRAFAAIDMMIKFERNHMKNIGFIGASGMMGHGMAKNIHAKGFSLSVSVNRNRDAVADLAAAGATVVDSPADLGSCGRGEISLGDSARPVSLRRRASGKYCRDGTRH